MIAARRHSSLQQRTATTLVPLLLLLLIIAATCALALSEPRHGPVSEPIEARRGGSLAAADGLDAAELVEGAREWHGAGAYTRRFAGPTTLAYITPWHKDGYEYAVRFRRKLTHVSPVWYQLRVHEEGGGEGGSSEGEEGGALALVGGHEYNATWLAELRAPVSGGGDSDEGALQADQACGNDGSGDGGGDNEAKKTCAANLEKQQQQHPSPPPPLIVPRVVVELAPRDLGLLLGRPGPAIDRLVSVRLFLAMGRVGG
jgi:hypothetical protein